MTPPYDDAGDPLERVDETLRLLATVAAPEGLSGRIKENLRTAPRSAGVIAWPRVAAQAGWMYSPLLRGAAAAAIVCVVAGGGWQIYSHVPAPTARVLTIPANPGNSGAFSSSDAKGRPDTLNGPVVPPSPIPAPRASDVTSRSLKQPDTATRHTRAGAKNKPIEIPR